MALIRAEAMFKIFPAKVVHNAKQKETLYPYTTNNVSEAKQYSSYGMALRGMKALTGKCDIPSCVTKRLSECK